MPSSALLGNVVSAGLFAMVATAMVNTKGLDEELGFYGAYHQNPWNQLIHFVFIPCIWWSILVMLCHVPFLPASAIGLDSIGGHHITWGTLQYLAYSLWYIYLDAAAGGLTGIFLTLAYLQASSAVASERAHNDAAHGKDELKKTKGMSWFTFAFILHALAWYMQIHPGHKILEGVKPALLDSLGQALGTAPMFAFLEGAWFVGLLPEMKGRVAVLVAENRNAMCAAGKPMPWC
mmetsp:Transcript_12190/g.33035  ORF Transcript_12190/g.33035 Transcript_12190/m.33035 type:complete len:234 (-) Transcript_12190:78-779(-)